MKTYEQAHRAIVGARGKANGYTCSCGKPACDWAYQHAAKDERISDGRPYSEDPNDYEPMCRGCHLSLDNGLGVVRGWATVWADPTPEFIKNNARAARQNGVGARQALAALQADPNTAAEIRKRQAEGGRTGGASRRRRCTCGREYNAPLLGRHQKATGHTGYEELG